MRLSGIVPRALRWVLLVGILLLVVLPRFNLHDPGPLRKFTAGATSTRYGLPLDVEGYIRLGKYFRHEMPADSLIPPYCYRPLVPLVASMLPWTVQTSINIVDVVCLILALLLLDKLLRDVGFGMRGRTVGCLLFAVSFPAFYYGAIGFVDPAVLLVVAAMTRAVLRGRQMEFAILLLLGVLVKETNALMAPLPWIWAVARGSGQRPAAGWTVLLLMLSLATAAAIRILSPFPHQNWFWMPRLSEVASNLSRPRAIVSLVLTIGPPGVVAAAAIAIGRARRNMSRQHLRFFLGGAGLVVVLYLYSLLSAYADGRVIWAAYPFVIPIAVTFWDSSVVPRGNRVASGEAR